MANRNGMMTEPMLTYALTVETPADPAADNVVRLRLTDDDGTHRGSHQVRLSDHRQLWWEGLFDTRSYVERFANALRDEDGKVRSADDLLAELGVFLGQHVLGPEITAALAKSRQRRTLVVQLPATEDDVLAAAFARVPWEIARPGPGEAPLMERALVVRAVTESTRASDSAVRRAAESLVQTQGVVRVLLVFAEAPGSRPLAMRLERERLRQLFEEEILPHRKVELDVLCHGVTRDEIREQITASGSGYHIVHWSGHGHHNRLELLGVDGGSSSVTGEDLVELIREAGGFVPQLFFLSACHSGAFVGMRDWAALQAALDGTPRADGDKQAQRSLTEVLSLDNAPGYTGTALALLRSGVPQVVAMRYSVGDGYARELAWWFYKRLLADREERTPADALAQARMDVRREHPDPVMPVDHANALVLGREGEPLRPTRHRSPQMRKLRPKPQPLLTGGSLELERRKTFVGRGQALTKLNRAWQKGGAAVTVVQGLGGLGKTALASEAVQLWHGRFDWVLAFEAKPTLPVEEFLRQVDLRLSVASEAYGSKCEEEPNERVYLEPSPRLRGEALYERMCTNLVEALRDEAVLVVLDNFESMLETQPRERGRYACADPHWDQVLRALSQTLTQTRSRVLVTTRHRPQALVDNGTQWLPLGPLTADEMALYVRNHEGLSRLLRGDAQAQAQLHRVLRVSRGHPLILERLATLVGDREGLDGALRRFEGKGYKALPELTVSLTKAQRELERAYLQDVSEGSVDVLLERLSPLARRLLWVVTLANEPMNEAMLAGVWSGHSEEYEQLLQLRALLAMRDHLPEALRAQLDALPEELRQQLDALPSEDEAETTPMEPLLVELHEAGLLDRQQSEAAEASGDESGVTLGFHELVRERVEAWMEAHPEERGGRTAEQVWVGYGERYSSAFEQLQMSGKPRAREAATEAGRRALVYMVRAKEFDKLGSFASALVTSTRDPVRLGHVIAELRAVVDQVPAGQPRWSVRTYLADALRQSGRPDKALPLYHEAVAEAEQAEDWADVAWVSGHWANALMNVGQLDAAKAAQLRSADAEDKAGRPLVNVVGRELEALRVDVAQGQAAQALPDIEVRLTRVRGWWNAVARGEDVPEAPDREVLGRALVSGLSVAWQANLALKHWQVCLDLLDEAEATKLALGESEHELAGTRFNRYGPLLALGRLDEAQHDLEQCLYAFRKVGDPAGESRTLTALADLWSERGDFRQAADLERQALAVYNRLPDPETRAISHANLANYLARLGQPERTAEHRLADLAYCLVSGHRDHLATTLGNLATDKRLAATEGRTHTLPRLAALLALPAFEPLHRFLTGGPVDLEALQAAIDQFEAQAEQAAAAPPPTPTFGALPPQLREFLAPLFQAAARGEDVEPLLAALRAQLVEQFSDDEVAALDAFLANIRTMLNAATATR